MERASFWRDLQAQFRGLLEGGHDLSAIRVSPGQWHIRAGPPGDVARARLAQAFHALAERAAIAAALVGPEPSIGWLEHLVSGPFFQPDTTVECGEDGRAITVPTGAGWLESLCTASGDACMTWETAAYRAERGQPGLVSATHRTGGGLAANLKHLRMECGWSLQDLADQAHVDRQTVLDHVNRGKGAHPRTLRKYADALSRGLHRPVTVEDLLR